MMSLVTVLVAGWGSAQAGTTYGPPSSRPPRDNAPAVAAGLELVELDSADIGGRRSAYVFVPEGNGPWPVIMAFHGGRNNSGLDMVERFESAKDDNVLLVFPNGTRTVTTKGPKEGGWTGPDQESDDPMRDVKFVRALIDELDRRYGIDRKEVYAAGFSAGALMTQWLWCQASDEIHGFFFVSRAMPVVMSQQCPARPARPVGMMLGTDDDALVNAHQLSFTDTKAYISGKLECREGPTTETLPDKNDSTTVHHSTWTGCARGSTFEYWEIEGGGHYWPGQQSGRASEGRTADVDATAELLRMFLRNNSYL